MSNLPPGWKKFGTLKSKRMDCGTYWQVTWDLSKEKPMKPVKRKKVTLRGLELDVAALAQQVEQVADFNLTARVTKLEEKTAAISAVPPKPEEAYPQPAQLWKDLLDAKPYPKPPKPCWFCRLMGRKA